MLLSWRLLAPYPEISLPVGVAMMTLGGLLSVLAAPGKLSAVNDGAVT